MKKILLTIIIAFTVCGAYSQWINQTVPIGFDGYINDMEVVDSNTVWGNPWNGTAGATTPYTKNFARTIDGGNTWTVGTITGSPAAALISNIWPIDADTCYVSMYGTTPATGGVHKTTDGGTTWAEVGTNMFTTATSFPNVVYFWDAQNGMAMGDPTGNPLKYEIYLTSDWGNTWTLVPPANIPALTNPAEYGITNLFSAAQGYIWFGTTYGDVYRSTDGGNNWTKSATGFPPFNNGGTEQDISDIAFSDSLHGLALQVDATPAALLKQTSDGGLTWVDVIPTGGTFFATDIDGVPGTTGGVFISSGSNTAFGFGTSISTDNGLTWTDLDVGASHTAIDFKDMNTGWTGEFIAAGSVGGAWKFAGIPPTVPCGSPTVSPGTTVANDSIICFNDTLTLTTNSVLAPTDGATHGFSILVSSADISGNNDPLNSGFILGGTGVILGPPPPTVLINSATGNPFGPGIFYFTPVVYGNATGTGNVTSLILDPTCTNTGISVMVNLLAQGDPLCTTGISEQNNSNGFGIKSLYPVPAKDKVNFTLAVRENGNVYISVKDFLGKEVLSKQVAVAVGENNLSLDISNQSAGVYFLTVTGNESTVVSKFVKD